MQEWQILYNLWERTCAKSVKTNETENWQNEVKALYSLGIGMEETLQFLYKKQPTENEFKNWLAGFKNNTEPEKIITGDVLNADDLRFWNENGYVLIKNVISKEQCQATQNAIWEFLAIDANNPDTWYKEHKEQRGLMLTFTHHPTLDANRNSAIVRRAYEQLYGTTAIYKTIDKVSFNPPENPNYNFLGDNLHWDVSLALPIPFSLQGLLYLTDCGPKDGAFNCVPGFHYKIDGWLNSLPANVNPREEAPKTLKPTAVTGNAGDFVIWHQALPHCATPNHGVLPRMVQYLTYLPEKYELREEWK